MTEGEKRDHVYKLNLARRHLDSVRWGLVFSKMCEDRGVASGKGKGNPHSDEAKTATVAVLAKEVGVTERTAERRLAAARVNSNLRVGESRRRVTPIGWNEYVSYGSAVVHAPRSPPGNGRASYLVPIRMGTPPPDPASGPRSA